MIVPEKLFKDDVLDLVKDLMDILVIFIHWVPDPAIRN